MRNIVTSGSWVLCEFYDCLAAKKPFRKHLIFINDERPHWSVRIANVRYFRSNVLITMYHCDFNFSPFLTHRISSSKRFSHLIFSVFYKYFLSFTSHCWMWNNVALKCFWQFLWEEKSTLSPITNSTLCICKQNRVRKKDKSKSLE